MFFLPYCIKERQTGGCQVDIGKLEDAEFKIMRQHTCLGILPDSNLPGVAQEIALGHRKRWDGTGYPHSLKTVILCIKY